MAPCVRALLAVPSAVCTAVHTATCAAVVAAVALCTVAVPPPAAASESGGAPGAPDTSRPRDPVTLMPPAGAPGSTVTVRARCTGEAAEPGGVFSPAFAEAAALRHGRDGDMVAEARVKPGLRPGRSYVVTANCSAEESLTTTFVTSGSPAQARLAAAAGHRSGTRSATTRGARANPVDGVALAFGGGLAGAALAGYVLTARRFTSRRGARAGRR